MLTCPPQGSCPSCLETSATDLALAQHVARLELVGMDRQQVCRVPLSGCEQEPDLAKHAQHGRVVCNDGLVGVATPEGCALLRKVVLIRSVGLQDAPVLGQERLDIPSRLGADLEPGRAESLLQLVLMPRLPLTYEHDRVALYNNSIIEAF